MSANEADGGAKPPSGFTFADKRKINPTGPSVAPSAGPAAEPELIDTDLDGADPIDGELIGETAAPDPNEVLAAERLEDLQVHGEAEREKVWAKLRAAFKVLAQAAEAGEKFYESEKRDKVERFANGIPVFQPLGVTYADFAVTAVLMMIRNISRDEAWKRVKVWDGGRWERLLTEMERRWGMIDEKMIT